MCGRYTNTRRSDDIEARLAETLGVRTPAAESGCERFNVAPTQEVLAVVDDSRGRRVEELRWGLVPHCAKGSRTRFAMINARAETLEQRPAYRGLVRDASRRCLVLADGWYEWQRPEDPRQPRRPLHFSLQGEELFCFAGLWTRWGAATTRSRAARSSPARRTNSFTLSMTACRSSSSLTPSYGGPGSTPRSTARPSASCSFSSGPSGLSCGRRTRSSTRPATRDRAVWPYPPPRRRPEDRPGI
jgi:putative SOS response-associated peptidase YedK